MSWQDQVRSLKIPYPQKAHLAREIEAHLRQLPEEATETFAAEDLGHLYETHNTSLLRFLEAMPEALRASFELTLAGGPLLAFLMYLKEEEFMLELIKEGGAGIYVILAVGGFLFAKEISLLWRTLVLKDHSEKNLTLDSASVGIGAFALLLLGISSTAMGVFYSASYVAQRQLPTAVFIQGIRESVTSLVLSCALAALALLLHLFTRRTLRDWQVPASLTG